MKLYAIGFEQIDGNYKFYAYTDTWLSERKLIDKEFYQELKLRFTLAHKNNKTISGMYFMPEL